MLRALVWLVVGVILAGSVDSSLQLLRPNTLAGPAVLDVATGERFHEVLDQLEKLGVLTNPRQTLYLAVLARFNHQANTIKAGEYRIDPGINAVQMLGILAEGKSILHELTIVEGLRFSQAWQLVAADPDLHHLLPAQAKPEEVMQAIGHPEIPAEGRFFPNTYLFPKGETDVAFLKRAYDAMDRELTTVWAERSPDLPFAKPQDALIMASLVEKESALPQERAQIAGVFVRRLNLHMRLETDPTVIYGLGDAYSGTIHTVNLRTDTPFNTYTREGLPPTPICLPGHSSLSAAVHPSPGKALYFVSRGDGTHAFAETLAEHQSNVRRYILTSPHPVTSPHPAASGHP